MAHVYTTGRAAVGDTVAKVWFAPDFAGLPSTGIAENDIGICTDGAIYAFDVNTTTWTLKYDPTTLVATTSVSTPSLISTGALTITPAAASNLNVALSTTGDFAVNTSQLYVDTSLNRVGVGLVAPVTQLHVGSAASAASTAVFTIDAHNGDQAGSQINIRQSAGTGAAPTIASSGSDAGLVQFQGYDGANYLSGARITGGIDAATASTKMPGNLIFYTATNATPSVITERMKINSAGLVTIADKFHVNASGLVPKYNNVVTTGWGLPAIYGTGRSTAQTAAVASVATYTVGAADGSFLVSANVLVTTATTHTFTAQCTYTDEGNTARTITLPLRLVGDTTALTTSITNANGAVPYHGVPVHIRAKAATAITILTEAAGTYTTVTYNVEGSITQIS